MSEDMRALDRLVGTWRISGGAEGTVRYEWLEVGPSRESEGRPPERHFLLQHVDLDGAKGLEVIGHEHPFGGERSADIKSRFYGSQGETFDYVYELDGDTLTVWGGEKGSPAYYRGTFSEDGNTLTGSWVYPDGGGYDSVAVRVSG